MSIGVSTSTKPWASMAPPDGPVDLGPRPQVALHAGLAQIDVAVPQAQGLIHLGPLVKGERRRLGP